MGGTPVETLQCAGWFAGTVLRSIGEYNIDDTTQCRYAEGRGCGIAFIYRATLRDRFFARAMRVVDEDSLFGRLQRGTFTRCRLVDHFFINNRYRSNNVQRMFACYTDEFATLDDGRSRQDVRFFDDFGNAATCHFNGTRFAIIVIRLRATIRRTINAFTSNHRSEGHFRQMFAFYKFAERRRYIDAIRSNIYGIANFYTDQT